MMRFRPHDGVRVLRKGAVSPGAGGAYRVTGAVSLRVACTSLAVLLAATPAQASDPLDRAGADARELEQRIEEGAQRLRALEAQVAQERQRLEAIRRMFEQHLRHGDVDLGRLAGRGLPGAVAQAPVGASGGASGGAPRAPVGEAPPAPERPAPAAQIFEEPTALTPPGRFVLEPAYQFVHSTDNRVALVGFSVIPAITIGLIDVRRVSRDINTLSLTGRYGLTNRFEVEAKVPWVHASSKTQTRPLATPSVTDETFDTSGSGIGDVELAARYQLNSFRGDNAVYIGYLRYKSRTGTGVFEVPIDPATGLQTELPTGSGFHGLQAGLTFLYPSDPAVFFGGGAYTHNFSRNVGNGFGTVRPGAVLDLNAGLGLALNERASFSIGYQHSIVGSTRQSDPESAARLLTSTGSLQLGTMRFGLGFRLSAKTNVNVSLGIGVTDDTPDFEFTLRMPYSL